VALSVKKGGTIHRRSGLLFVCAMLVMGISGSILGFRNSAADGNVMAGLMTAYFVGTALTTVRPSSRWTSRINAAALTIAVGLAILAVMSGVKGVNTGGLSPGGVPFRTIGVMSFISALSVTERPSGHDPHRQGTVPRQPRTPAARAGERSCAAILNSCRVPHPLTRLRSLRIARASGSVMCCMGPGARRPGRKA
jgi:hypothetical protein